MRTIKFRAWHKDAKEMLYPSELSRQGDVFHWLAEGQPVEIMQFTGLYDKNGKEIYEGDILSWSMYYKNSYMAKLVDRRNKIVKWCDEKTAWILDDERTWNLGIYDDIEVIGNIYETPELLKEE